MRFTKHYNCCDKTTSLFNWKYCQSSLHLVHKALHAVMENGAPVVKHTVTVSFLISLKTALWNFNLPSIAALELPWIESFIESFVIYLYLLFLLIHSCKAWFICLYPGTCSSRHLFIHWLNRKNLNTGQRVRPGRPIINQSSSLRTYANNSRSLLLYALCLMSHVQQYFSRQNWNLVRFLTQWLDFGKGHTKDLT